MATYATRIICLIPWYKVSWQRLGGLKSIYPMLTVYMEPEGRFRRQSRVTVIRTLNLPRDFQLVLRRRDVRKVDATRGFGIRHRAYSGFWIAVRSVYHTARSFAKYVLHRFRKYLERIAPQVARGLESILPPVAQPELLPRVENVLFIAFWLWYTLVLWFARVREKLRARAVRLELAAHDRNVVRLPRFGEVGYDPAIRAVRRVPRYRAFTRWEDIPDVSSGEGDLDGSWD